MSEHHLINCPFCGASDPKLSCDDMGFGQFRIRMLSWWIQCRAEDCHALQQGSCEENVVRRWNMRA